MVVRLLLTSQPFAGLWRFRSKDWLLACFTKKKSASRSVGSVVQPSLEAKKLPIADAPTTADFGRKKFQKIISVQRKTNPWKSQHRHKIMIYMMKSQREALPLAGLAGALFSVKWKPALKRCRAGNARETFLPLDLVKWVRSRVRSHGHLALPDRFEANQEPFRNGCGVMPVFLRLRAGVLNKMGGEQTFAAGAQSSGCSFESGPWTS